MNNKLKFLALIFSVTLFAVQAQTTFGDQNVIIEQGVAEGASSVYCADIDGDGDMDVLSASMDDNKIAWYENKDGNGTFGTQQVITTDVDWASSVFASDLDGDGDLDVVSSSGDGIDITWYENTDGNGTFGAQQVITADPNGASAVYCSDIDGDGDMDVLSALSNDNKIAWYENTDGNGTFGTQQVISINANGANSVYCADMDGDGDMDVLSASWNDDKIAWYENTDGNGTFGTQQVISINANGANSVYCADTDGDGDMDVLSASWNDDKIAWYENTDGNGTFGTQQVISINANGANSVYCGDIDGDGDMDVLSASEDDNKIAWYENTDGNGTFGTQQVISINANGATSVYCGDIDGDGDMDVLSASEDDNKIAWYENTDGNGTFGTQQVLTIAANTPESICSADIDGDGDMDVLSASFHDDKIAWYENTDGSGTFGTQQSITTDANGARDVCCADIDGDGDMDVLSASSTDDKIAWYENTDGNGSFGIQQVITTVADNARSVYSADLDGDGDMDVLSASEDDDKIAWYENTDGNGTFGVQQIISTTAYYALSVYSADLDSDGDMDVLSASATEYEDKICWYENTDGNGTFGTQQIITTDAYYAVSIYSADIDGDGDMDVLSASSSDDKIAWYENTDGNGIFGPQNVITTAANGAQSVYSADLDGDGDMDVLSASFSDNKIAWYENTDGNGTFGAQQVITTEANAAIAVYCSDLDGDGDMDVISASIIGYKIAWYENLLVTRIETIQQNGISIYPNPSSGEFTIQGNEIQRIDIFNLNGQLIKQTEATKDEIKIDLNGNSKGIYTVKVITSKGTSVHKVVVE